MQFRFIDHIWGMLQCESEAQNRIRKHCEPANSWKGIVWGARLIADSIWSWSITIKLQLIDLSSTVYRSLAMGDYVSANLSANPRPNSSNSSLDSLSVSEFDLDSEQFPNQLLHSQARRSLVISSFHPFFPCLATMPISQHPHGRF